MSSIEPAPGAVNSAVWEQCHDQDLWERTLTSLQGHPLQSWLWGAARQQVDGIDFRCLLARDALGTPIALARVERRAAGPLGGVAWIPRGPVSASGAAVPEGLEARLRADGFSLCAGSPWREATLTEASVDAPRTIWLDLSIGREALLAGFDSQWRYGARRALREGLQIEQCSEPPVVSAFYGLCQRISQHKRFDLPGSEALMQALLSLSRADAPVQAHLFVARHDDRLAGGVFVLRAGAQLHYLWGGVERGLARLRAGEALHWAVIEWGLAQQCRCYDLEGIDPLRNPGTYQFKKKFGGREVVLTAPFERSLDWRGRLLQAGLQLRRQLAARQAGSVGGV